ncbi:amidase domain-containing protein [Microlunatus flavus]|uniref:amidase domain-containing protein n=1 Tax=Microlunatus flavus TaxID=1036181 RepID=UPI000B8229E7|nr:amidase domain-containing protein [Microlunatus flavus]
MSTLGAAGLSPAVADTSPAITSADQLAIAQYYQSKKVIGQGLQPTSLNTSTVQAPASVGNAYLQDFYASYADDPDVVIKGVQITPTILLKVVSGSVITYRVSVRVSFQLHDNSDGTDFTGGETVDHTIQAVNKLVTITDPTTFAASTSTTTSIQSDGALDVSTAPLVAVTGTTEDAQVAAMSSTAAPLPAWQLQLKQVSDDQGAGASRIAADEETSGSQFSEDTVERLDLSKTPYAADDPAADDPAAAEYTVDTTARASSTNYFPSLNFRAAASYASLWTDDNHAGKINTKYGDAGDNCTNFISQALYSGGWKTRNTTYAGRKWKSRWHWNYRGPGKYTYTWSRAHYSYRRMVAVGNRLTFANMENAGLADLGYFDWNVGGATANDGVMDHVMIVTKRTKKHPYFSQKSGNRHNVPPREVRKNIGNHTYKFYGVHT